jgi:Ca2+/H+ antiporter
MTLGQTVSGLLNASFGNAVEIIVGIAALLQGSSIECAGTAPLLIRDIFFTGQMRIVQTSVGATTQCKISC